MKAVHIFRAAALALTLATVSCTDSVRQGTGSSFLIVDQLAASSGAEPELFGGTLQSDVITIVDGSPTLFNDLGQVTFSVGLKDPGRATTPTQNLAITVDRYHVKFVRADGRNTPGVDVPYPFDGSLHRDGAGGGNRDGVLPAGPAQRQAGGAARRARVQPGDRIDDRGDHVLRPRLDRARSDDHRPHRRRFRKFRRPRLTAEARRPRRDMTI